jgi:hypothetical protein
MSSVTTGPFRYASATPYKNVSWADDTVSYKCSIEDVARPRQAGYPRASYFCSKFLMSRRVFGGLNSTSRLCWTGKRKGRLSNPRHSRDRFLVRSRRRATCGPRDRPVCAPARHHSFRYCDRYSDLVSSAELEPETLDAAAADTTA